MPATDLFAAGSTPECSAELRLEPPRGHEGAADCRPSPASSTAYRSPAAVYHADGVVSPPIRPVSYDTHPSAGVLHRSRPSRMSRSFPTRPSGAPHSESRRCRTHAIREQTRHCKQESSSLASMLTDIPFVIFECEFQQPGRHNRPYFRRARLPVEKGKFPDNRSRGDGRKRTDTTSRAVNCRYLEPS